MHSIAENIKMIIRWCMVCPRIHCGPSLCVYFCHMISYKRPSQYSLSEKALALHGWLVPHLHAKPCIPGDEKLISTVVIHKWRWPCHQFARARTVDEFDVSMPVSHVRITSQTNWSNVTSQKSSSFATMPNSTINNCFFSGIVCSEHGELIQKSIFQISFAIRVKMLHYCFFFTYDHNCYVRSVTWYFKFVTWSDHYLFTPDQLEFQHGFDNEPIKPLWNRWYISKESITLGTYLDSGAAICSCVQARLSYICLPLSTRLNTSALVIEKSKSRHQIQQIIWWPLSVAQSWGD